MSEQGEKTADSVAGTPRQLVESGPPQTDPSMSASKAEVMEADHKAEAQEPDPNHDEKETRGEDSKEPVGEADEAAVLSARSSISNHSASGSNLEACRSESHYDTGQLTKDELSYGLGFFSHQLGYQNKLNFVTPTLFQRRFRPITDLSLHSCEHLLRAPFNGTINGRPVGSNTKSTLGKRTLLTPQNVAEILDYRIGPSDDRDFAFESFKLLGAQAITDRVPIAHLADLLLAGYQNIEDDISMAGDFQEVVRIIQDREARLERLKEKGDNIERKKMEPVRAIPMPRDSATPLPPPKLREPNGLSNKAISDPRSQYALPLREDIITVLRICCPSEDDTISYESWRDLFKHLQTFQFVDYREEITNAGK
ncbi:hypothetical protein GMRT_13540 [Giardia muris]|uniref:Uncharacterized protein n=1 Tax=Giardia muris TaxID=5742 RepID=A0A4Z1SWL9_GIAMU|nr:hypothetical protein GMRT_13540 [Giardia muris]|eukprot:TNJ29960.1 hypothetical protein GMRT_13540 [Giardia muris]